MKDEISVEQPSLNDFIEDNVTETLSLKGVKNLGDAAAALQQDGREVRIFPSKDNSDDGVVIATWNVGHGPYGHFKYSACVVFQDGERVVFARNEYEWNQNEEDLPEQSRQHNK
ncbi:MAG: hypothetical protein KDB01_25875 [Planctomycetaceae bacterium]|nr:hypothetical protein [Planctomycetaceae bacterium]